MSKSIYRERLELLLDHMENGQRGHDTFAFWTVHMDAVDVCETTRGEKLPPNCGSLGCMMGEMPYVWPDLFKLNTFLGTVDPMCPTCSNVEEEFFGLDNEQSSHVFYPMAQDTGRYGGKLLTGNATLEEVVANAREFLECHRWEGEVDG